MTVQAVLKQMPLDMASSLIGVIRDRRARFVNLTQKEVPEHLRAQHNSYETGFGIGLYCVEKMLIEMHNYDFPTEHTSESLIALIQDIFFEAENECARIMKEWHDATQ